MSHSQSQVRDFLAAVIKTAKPEAPLTAEGFFYGGEIMEKNKKPSALGHETFDAFYRNAGMCRKKYYRYEYLHTDGQSFSCIKTSLELCRIARNEWLKKQEA